jgi:hypothetical protein
MTKLPLRAVANALGSLLAEGTSASSWWRGLPVMAALTFLASLPLVLFPASLPGAPPEPEERCVMEEEEDRKWRAEWRASWRGLARLLTTPALISSVWAQLHVATAILGFRYQFRPIYTCCCRHIGLPCKVLQAFLSTRYLDQFYPWLPAFCLSWSDNAATYHLRSL